ncbi:MAG TPA: hypothetical protein VGL91_15015 [Acidobacteriota bacterium]|jgi:hypothetical protein
MHPPQETKKALIVVRTYPIPDKRGVEVSCTAAITEQGEWLRLFPIPYRFLPQDQRFRKYQWIEVSVTKASDDPRPESFRLKRDSIRILSEPLSTDNYWQARKDFVFPLKAHCLCCLQRQHDEKSYPTLGFFRPKVIERLVIKQEKPNWTQAQQEMLRQGHLFEKGPQTELEKIPYTFRYEFRCEEDTCSGHTMICTDWEMAQSWRSWKKEYANEWEDKFRHRYETEMIEKNDTHFYVGTVKRHPKTWIIVGLFYPPKSLQGGLF